MFRLPVLDKSQLSFESASQMVESVQLKVLTVLLIINWIMPLPACKRLRSSIYAYLDIASVYIVNKSSETLSKPL